MDSDSMDELLWNSRPLSAADEVIVDGRMRDLVSAARVVAEGDRRGARSSRTRRSVLFGGVALAALGLTAGAVLTFLPGTYVVTSKISFPYPLNPFDDTPGPGPIQCVAEVQFDKLLDQGARQEIESFIGSHDWSELGVVVYATAGQDSPSADPNGYSAVFTDVLGNELQTTFERDLPDVARYTGVAVTCEGDQ